LKNTTGTYHFLTNLGRGCSLVYDEKRNGVHQPDEILWNAVPLPAALLGQTEMEWEFRAVGDVFSAWANGQFVASAHHSRVPTGTAWIASDAGLEITKLQTINFASGTASLQPATAALEPGAIKLGDTPEKIPKKPGIRWENGVVILDSASLRQDRPISRDAILRAEVCLNPDADGAQLGLRVRAAKSGVDSDFYRLLPAQENGAVVVSLISVHADKTTLLQRWPLPRAYGPDEWLRLEVRAIGDEITVSADGQPLGTVHDVSQPAAGSVMLFAVAHGNFRNIVYVPLDKAASAAPPAVNNAVGTQP
jgi:hypothetical protein